jgi:CRISPR-associated protein Cmr2
MHQYDTSAYDHHLGLTKDSAKGSRIDEERFKEKVCDFSNVGFGTKDIAKLPADSFALEVKFEFVTPYVSKDDMGTAEEHSPIVKDWVYQVPMVRPTTWKGRLRFSAAQQSQDHQLIKHLFGPLKESVESLEGRLHFYPTFFPSAAKGQKYAGTEVLNPHSRLTRRGRKEGPVTLQCVNPGAIGILCLLYLAPAEPEIDQAAIRKSVVSWVREMIEFHGIGGKTLKGFGLGSISRIHIIDEKDKIQVWPDGEGGPQ